MFRRFLQGCGAIVAEFHIGYRQRMNEFFGVGNWK